MDLNQLIANLVASVQPDVWIASPLSLRNERRNPTLFVVIAAMVERFDYVHQSASYMPWAEDWHSRESTWLWLKVRGGSFGFDLCHRPKTEVCVYVHGHHRGGTVVNTADPRLISKVECFIRWALEDNGPPLQQYYGHWGPPLAAVASEDEA